jgi:hypothetical protein
MLTDRSIGGVRYAAYVTFLLGLLTASAGVVGSPSAPIALTWTPSTDPSVAGYNIYYGTASRSYTNVVSNGGLSFVTISNLLSGNTYYFAATSYNAAGLESAYSGEAAYSVPTNAIIHASLTSGPIRSLTIQGLVGNTYQVQYSTNLGAAPVWYPLLTYGQTNFTQKIILDPSPVQIFYRVHQQ